MTFFDVFNGDADGICALHQLRLAQPRDAVLVTGVKRDTALLQRIAAAPGDHITVLDIPLDRNRGTLLALDDISFEIAPGEIQIVVDDRNHPPGRRARRGHEIDRSGAACDGLRHTVDANGGKAYRLALQYGTVDAVLAGASTIAREGAASQAGGGHLWQPYTPLSWPALRDRRCDVLARRLDVVDERDQLGAGVGRNSLGARPPS